MRFAHRLRYSTLPLVLMCSLGACFKWSAVHDRAPTTVMADQSGKGNPVRLHLSDGTVVTFNNPWLRNDTLFDGSPPRGPRIAAADVTAVEVKRADPVRTGLLLAGVTGIIVAVIAAASSDPAPQPVSGDDVIYSCPTVYSWDGAEWRMDSGTFGGAISAGLARTDIDNLEHAIAIDGVVRLKVRNELRETDYIDAVSLLVVTHEAGITIAPSSNGTLYGLGALATPTRAFDRDGRDILDKITAADGVAWESRLDVRDPGDVAALTDGIELTFARASTAQKAKLLITGQNTVWASSMIGTFLDAHGSNVDQWYARIDSDPGFARATREALARTAFLHVYLWTASGWQQQDIVWEVGPEVMKRQVVPIDLTNAAPGDIRLRLEAPPSFWLIDHVAIDFSADHPFTVTEVHANQAAGTFGSAALGALNDVDGQMQVLETDEEIDLTFKVPPVEPGRDRTYMLSTTGWYRIHRPATAAPDLALLESIAAGPLAMQRTALELRNRAIARLQVH